MKGASMILMVLFLSVFAIPLMAAPDQGETGFNFLRISIMNIKEVNIDQAVTAPVYIESVAILPNKQKMFVPLEFQKSKTSHSNNNFVMNNGQSNIRKRRIKSGRH